MAAVVDTSILYAAFDAADPHHATAAEALDGHLGLEIPPVVWSELESTVRKKAGLSQARDTLPAFLRANRHVGIMDADLHPEAMRIWSKHGRLSYADCHAIAGALLLGNQLVTLDKRQEAAWRAERRGQREASVK